MRTIETTAWVAEDGTLTIQVPPDIPPGNHAVVVVIEEQAAPVAENEPDPEASARLEEFIKNWPVHDLGPWPENLSLRREDMYDDWGR